MAETLRYFVILGAMRTGSNLLEKTLEQLGDTVCYGEAFNPSFISGPRKKQVLGHTVETRDADPIAFLRHLISARPKKIAGFRLFVGHEPKVIDHVLQDPNCARIVLRRTPLDSYISLKIARKTDQWMLRNPRKRIQVQVSFDAEEYECYRNRLSAFYDRIDALLQQHGEEPFRIDYSELGNQSVLQRLAAWIGSTGTIPATPPILRQNPDSLAAKVENYAEMCDALGLAVEDQALGRNAGTKAFLPQPLWPDGFPVAYVPITGPAFEPMVALLHRIEVRDFGRTRIPAPDLSDRALRCVLYQEKAPADVPCVAMVCHPFRRLHAAFVNEMFGNGWQFSTLRRALVRTHGPMPSPRLLQQTPEDYTPERQRQHFDGFIQMVSRALNGDDDVPVLAEWRPQTDLLDDHAERCRIDHVFLHEAFGDAVNWFTEHMGLDAFPPGQIKGMAQTGRQKLLEVEDVVTPELRHSVMQLYRADYARFGYEAQPPVA